MPIYEYEAVDANGACPKCARRFEVIHGVSEEPLTQCPECHGEVRRVISWCRACVVERDESHARIESQIREHEAEGRWSHAAELADKHSEQIKDSELKSRALDNYKKAGYEFDSTVAGGKTGEDS